MVGAAGRPHCRGRQRVFDVDAPGFRGATLTGVIAGALVAVATAYFIWGYRRRGRKLHESKA